MEIGEYILDLIKTQGLATFLVVSGGWFIVNRLWPVVESMLRTVEKAMVSAAASLEIIAANASEPEAVQESRSVH